GAERARELGGAEAVIVARLARARVQQALADGALQLAGHERGPGRKDRQRALADGDGRFERELVEGLLGGAEARTRRVLGVSGVGALEQVAGAGRRGGARGLGEEP